MEFYPYNDADVQSKIKAELGEDKILVFNEVSGMVHVAEKIGSRYVIDVSTDLVHLNRLVHDMEDGRWILKSS